MAKKFAEAITILWNNLGLFAAITLTIWLPGNLLVNFIMYSSASDNIFGLMKITIWIDGIFGPICIGALIYALYHIKLGRKVTYRDAMGVGFKKWGALFAARFVAGLLITLGFFALIIPGIILSVRYALLDAAVILEDKGASESRSRSIDLTAGKRWEIFGVAVLFFIPFLICSFVIYLPLGYFESLNLMLLEVALDCILDIVFVILQIVIFLFYWEAIQESNCTEEMVETEGVPVASQS